MIPTTIEQEETVTPAQEQTSRTYYMDLDKKRVHNHVDGLNVMKQCIFKILQTERYLHSKIYSDNYGVEFQDLYGASPVYAVPEIERRITEALEWDDRINTVTDFEFEQPKAGVIAVSFKANTIFGTVTIAGVEVKI